MQAAKPLKQTTLKNHSDIGIVVDRHTVAGLELGYSIEFFDMLGQTVALATLPGSLLRVPTHSDRPTVRSSALSA